MKLNKANFYTYVIVIVLFLQLYLPSFKANTFIQIGALGLFFLVDRPMLSLSFLRTTFPVAVLFAIGFVGMFGNDYPLYNIIKDIFHFIKPLLGLALGYLYFRAMGYERFVRTVVIAGFISAIAHIAIVVFLSGTSTVNQIREFSKDNFLELFSIFFLGYYHQFNGKSLFAKKATFRWIFWILLLSNILYFSRTMIGVAVLLWLSIKGLTVITATTIKIGATLLMLVVLLYAYLFSVKIERDKNGFESFLYKVKIAPEELFETRIDRENHADLWDHWRGYETKRALALLEDQPSGYVYGCGYGSLVNLKFYAPLTGEKKGMRYISELHNGYAYMLYKTGILGLLIYLWFLITLYRKIDLGRTFPLKVISATGLIYMFTTLTITGIYNTKDIIIFILGAMLYFQHPANAKPKLT